MRVRPAVLRLINADGEVLDGETDLFTLIVEKASVVVRSEHELYDRVASKCLSDRTLDSVRQTGASSPR